MRYPEFLDKNGKIGFVAPSFGWASEPYISRGKSALERFDSLGYSIVLGPNVYADCGLGKSNTAKACGEELTEFMTNDSCDIVLSCGGGETMCEDLDYVDFEAIKNAKPKWYMGYSDNTHFTFPLTTLCDTASIYGPCAASFGMRDLHPALEDALGILDGSMAENVTGACEARASKSGNEASNHAVITVRNYDGWEGRFPEDINDGDEPTNAEPQQVIALNQTSADAGLQQGDEPEDPLKSYDINMPFNLKIYVPEKNEQVTCHASGNASTKMEKTCHASESVSFSGRLIGGCLDCLINLSGTRFDGAVDFAERYKDDGIIWFMESCDLSPMDVRRGLWHLENAGWFKHVRGFVFGRPYHYDEEMMGLTHYDAITSMLAKYNVPIIMDADIGHLPPSMPIISGALAEVRATGARGGKSTGELTKTPCSLEIKMHLV